MSEHNSNEDSVAMSKTEPNPELGNDEASLAGFIISHYEGDRDNKGFYEGHGEVSFTGGNTYQGSLSKGMMHGKGLYRWSDGMSYEGDMTDNQISGYGRYQWKDNSFYEGEVFNGLRHGVGVFKSKDAGMSFSGQWCLGKRHGRGIMHYNEHSWYEGDWVNNSRHGWGVRRYHTGNVYEGQWINDKRHGDGTMRWLTTNESYTGMWENGVQHGYGTHTWYLNRVPGSQYPLRNEYVGDFVNGLRHGHGKFFFASGAVYDGEWENGKKHGWGKFIFKNGRIFEGQFENDHMIDYPNLELNGTESPELTSANSTATANNAQGPAAMSKDGCGNILGPNLTIDVDFLLEKLPLADRDHEIKQVTFLMIRNISLLRRVYSFYSALGHDRSPDNTFVMTRFQFWRFLKDCRLHHYTYSLTAMDRAVARCNTADEVHNPMEKILLREFLSTCIAISYFLFEKTVSRDGVAKTSVLSQCLQCFIDKHLKNFSCHVGGYFLFEPRRAVTALAYMDKSWQIYQTTCTNRPQPPQDPTLTMRQFLFLLQDLKIIGKNLTTAAVLQILAVDDPTVSDGETCNMELEMTFLEFFEAIVGCALQFHAEPAHEVNVEKVSSIRTTSPLHGQTDVNEDMSVVSRSQTMKSPSLHSEAASRSGAECTGQFLQTLSQMSIHGRDPDTASKSYDDFERFTEPVLSADNKSKPLIPAQEEEFSNWTNRLNIFFVHYFFPAWNRMETLRNEAAREKAANKEKQRVLYIEQEAERRRTLNSGEASAVTSPEAKSTQSGTA